YRREEDEREEDERGGVMYRPRGLVELFGQKVHVTDLSWEISDRIPVYPGHAKFAMWWHLTHDEVKTYRLPPDSRFDGYAVKGMSLCDHLSTHMDAVYHFNKHAADMTIETVPLETMITPG